MRVRAHSSNLTAPAGQKSAQDYLGWNLTDFLSPAIVAELREMLTLGNVERRNPLRVSGIIGSGPANMIVHEADDLLYLEFEPREKEVSSSSFLHRMDQALRNIQQSGDADDLFGEVAREIKDLTGFDRVMLYRFDEAYNGEVVGEALRPDLPPYLHLRYPHTDIPKQARELYLLNHIRHIIDTNRERATTIITEPGLAALDLSMMAGRGSSPIHLQYLENMKVGASMSIALIVDRKLWGLIACHNGTPKIVDYRLRAMISIVGRVLSGHLALRQTSNFRAQILETSILRSLLLERMSETYDIVHGLMQDDAKDLQKLVDATGVMILLDDKIFTGGTTPQPVEMRAIAAWLDEHAPKLFNTTTFFDDLPEARSYSEPPAGILSIRLSREPGEYIVWFRPEITRTVMWGGRPDQRKHIEGDKVKLHPNISFEAWREQLSGIAEDWEDHQVDAAHALRNDIKEIILLKFKEMQKINGQLVGAYDELESFSYTVSHDLRAPLRNIKGFAEILREDYHELLDDHGKYALDTIVTSVGKMDTFINDILAFSKLGSTNPVFGPVNLREVTEEVWHDLKNDARDYTFTTEFTAETLIGDYTQIKQLVLNLLSNAVKYSRKTVAPAVGVNISASPDGAVSLIVSDNGIGINMKYAERIFTVFNRLVSDDDYEGTGVGLGIAKRIVDNHGARISVVSEPGKGATFTVVFPPPETQDEDE